MHALVSDTKQQSQTNMHPHTNTHTTMQSKCKRINNKLTHTHISEQPDGKSVKNYIAYFKAFYCFCIEEKRINKIALMFRNNKKPEAFCITVNICIFL